jgi:hypothetical protein
MTPFSAFFIFLTGVAIAEHNADDKTAPATQLPKATAPATQSSKELTRGGSYSGKEVLDFQSNAACKDADAANASNCGNFPQLATVPASKEDWLALARKSVTSFALGFGQTDFGGSNKNGPAALTTSEFFPEILNIGLTPRGKTNLSREFEPTKGYKAVSYDLRICSLGGRVRVKVTDKSPLDELSKPDTINTQESACEEIQFSTEPSILSSVLTQVESGSGKSFNLTSKGQVARTIHGKRYAGSVISLNQDLDLTGDTPSLSYNDGAIGYCVGTPTSGNNWDQQCLKSGVVMDGFRLTKTFLGSKVAFPGVSYIALSLADGVDKANKPVQNKYEMVGKDLEIAKGAAVPSSGVLTIVGNAGEKVRMIFKEKSVDVVRLSSSNQVTETVTLPSSDLLSK